MTNEEKILAAAKRMQQALPSVDVVEVLEKLAEKTEKKPEKVKLLIKGISVI